MMLEPGQAMLIKAGSILTFQVHYTANGTPANDQSSIGFIFAKEPPRQEVHSSAFVNATFAIPPGASDYLIDSAIEFNRARARSWRSSRTRTCAGRELGIPADLSGRPFRDRALGAAVRLQLADLLPVREAAAVPKGARLEASAKYDNSAANNANPDPKIEVHWGEQTWEEMQYSGITFVVDEPGRTAN